MRNKKILTVGAVSGLALLLAACGNKAATTTTLAPPSGIFGTFYNWFGRPMQQLMEWIAQFFNSINGYGWAIILITLGVRLLLLPLMLRQQNKMTYSQEKMRVLKPQLDILQKQMKKPGITPEEQMRINTMMREVYAKNGTSMIPSMGCLTLLIQLPFLSGLYQAVAYSPEISGSRFFGIELGKSSLILTFAATVIYMIQSWVMLQGYSEEQRKTMQMTAWMGPITTLIFCMMYNAGLGLYFFSSGLMVLLQQVIVTFILVPAIRKKMDAEIAETPPVIVVDEHTFDVPVQVAQPERRTINETESGDRNAKTNNNPNDHRRNAGRQRRR